MPKIVINTCYGGFGLSEQQLNEYKDRAGITDKSFSYWHIARDCPHLVAMVEEGGTNIGGMYSDLRIVDVPDDVKWHIHEYDGLEHVAENHRTWS